MAHVSFLTLELELLHTAMKWLFVLQAHPPLLALASEVETQVQLAGTCHLRVYLSKSTRDKPDMGFGRQAVQCLQAAGYCRHSCNDECLF